MKLENLNLPDEMASKLRTVEKRWLGVESASTSLLSLSIFLSSLVFMYLSDRLWDTAPIIRLLLLITTLSSFGFYLISHFKRRKVYTDTPYKLIDLIQKHYPQLGDSLQGAVELSNEGTRPDNISPELCRAAVAQVAQKTSELSFEASIHTDQRNRFSRLFALVALLVIVFFTLDNKALLNTLERWVNPFSSAERYTFVQLNDLPEEMIVLHGETFSLEVSVKEDSRFKPEDISWHFTGLPKQLAGLQDGHVKLDFPGQTSETILNISSFDCVKIVKIIPVYRPAITELQATVKMPAYLQHEDLKLELSGNTVELIEGSRMILEGIGSNSLKSVGIYNPSSSEVSVINSLPLEERPAAMEALFNEYKNGSKSLTASVTGKSFSSQLFKAENDQHFFITWLDDYGFKQKEPFNIQVQTLKDVAPQVEFQNVSRAFALLSTENIPLPVNATDNFGVKYLKLEYEVQSPSNENFSKTFTHLIKEGGPDIRSLSGEFIFTPSQLNIPEGSIVKIRALTNDYLPGRKDIVSADYKVFVLSKEEHAKLIQDRFDSLNSKLEGIGMQEDENLQKNLEIADMDLDDLNSQEGQNALEESLAAEKANAKRLQQLIDEGMDLIEEALKNEEFGEDQLREWTEMLDELNELTENEMAEVQQELAQASQEESASNGLRIEGLKGAIQKQQEVMRKLRRLSKDFDENMKKATLRNFAARLRGMSKKEVKVANLLQQLFVKSVGMDFENLPDELKRLNDKILNLQKKEINVDIAVIKQEITSFYARTKIEKYRQVTDDMEKKQVLDGLKELTYLIEVNKASSAIAPAKEWSKCFTEWAELLDPKPSDDENQSQDQNEQENQQQNMEILLAIIRVIEEEQDIHSETKFLDWQQKMRDKAEDEEKAEKNHTEAAEKLADRQKGNIDKLKEIREKLQKSKVTKLMDDAENAMDEAERLLRRHNTGQNTLSAEAAAVELLIAIFEATNQSSGSSSAMMSMMQQMMQEGSSSRGSQSGSNNQGGDVVVPTEVKGSGDGEKLADRNPDKHSGVSIEEVPVEFREALESYYKEVEKSLE